MMSLRYLSAILVLVCAPSLAQIYKTTDAQGNVVYTDTPPGDSTSERVDLQPTNTLAPPPPKPEAAPSKPERAAAEPVVPQAVITEPANETTIPMGGGNFTVAATVAPGLHGGQGLQLLIDGEPEGAVQPNATWNLMNVFRGAHDLVVQVVDSEGKVLSRSEPVRVYVLRPGLN
jgi:hypothetical protein